MMLLGINVVLEDNFSCVVFILNYIVDEVGYGVDNVVSYPRGCMEVIFNFILVSRYESIKCKETK